MDALVLHGPPDNLGAHFLVARLLANESRVPDSDFRVQEPLPLVGLHADVDRLAQLIALPSVAAQKRAIPETAQLLRGWLEEAGIEADQTFGPSKRGNVGFLFGTCHPYFPIAWFDEQNRIYDVLEIGFLTQDLDLPQWSDTSVIVPFLERVRQVEGVAHFLFHQVHIHRNPNVNRAIRQVVEEARRRGFAFWTSAEINDWERARRRVVITGVDEGGAVRAQGTDAADVVVWIPLPEHRSQDGAERKFGVPCRKVVLNAEKRGVELEGSR